ncbi:MAG: hypothetical protein E6Q68_02890 [Polynucleobacter sp.]|nr:MAG: hypothetical protein E6Q68_02890 [Polynucleobacter sp.]
MHLIVYLHGFKSSPRSSKALLTQEAVERLQSQGHSLTWCCPQLPPSPKETIALVTSLIEEQTFDRLSLIGSSLGGYYATYLAEQYASKACLLNPAIEPARDLEKYIGEQKSWHGDDSFYFKADYIQELLDIYIPKISKPDRYFLLAAQGDEVLDWREMVAKYPGATQKILEGGDHAITNYSEYLSDVLSFIDLPNNL